MSKTALYLRLSKEDRLSTESDSIVSQRIYLRQYAAKNGLQIDLEFIDDGVSGTILERTGLQAMLSAVKAGDIQTILVKDLSRLSRNYIHTGELLEHWFPAYQVRLISVNDHFDSAAISAWNDFSPLRAVMDDWYARDISKKVREAIYARQAAGLCTISTIPYGYIRVKKRLEPVQEQVDVIKYIFNKYLEGESCLYIANQLNRLKVCTPSGKGEWHDTTIRRILKNPIYAGKLRLHTTRRISYKCRIKQLLPESEAIIFHVPPIIRAEQFTQIQTRLCASAHIVSSKHWISGKVFCGICGANMIVINEKKNVRLICSNRKHKRSCTNPSCRYDKLLCQFKQIIPETGFPNEENIFRSAIQRVVISRQQIDLFLQTSRPQRLDAM